MAASGCAERAAAADGGLLPTVSNTSVERTDGLVVPLVGGVRRGAAVSSAMVDQVASRGACELVGELGIGPIVGTLRMGDRGHGPVLELLGRYCGRVRDRGYGLRWYGEAAKVGEYKSLVAWAPRVQLSPSDEVHVEVTQSECDSLGLEVSLELLRELLAMGMRVSRIDAHRDDRAGLTNPREVFDAFVAGDVLSRVHRESREWHEKGSRGATACLGSRQSGRFLRVYNGDVLHGEGTGTRWELEHHGARAQQFAGLVAGSVAGDYGELVTSAFRAVVDFVERGSRDVAHGERGELLGWWSAFVDGAARALLRLPSRVESIANKLRWCVQTVAPTLALVAAFKGGVDPLVYKTRGLAWLRDLVRDGAARVTADQLQLLPRELRPIMVSVL